MVFVPGTVHTPGVDVKIALGEWLMCLGGPTHEQWNLMFHQLHPMWNLTAPLNALMLKHPPEISGFPGGTPECFCSCLAHVAHFEHF